jgi:hypothetical protein
VNSPMRRTIFLALVAALLLVSTAHAAGTTQILRDCADDGILQGDYSAADLRTARDHIPAELNEYSDCNDVLSRAIAAKTAASGGGGGGGGTTGGGTTGGGGPAGGAPAPANLESGTPKGRDPGFITGPAIPQDWEAINKATAHGADAIPVNGRRVSPAAHVGRNGMPGTLIAVLALLTAAALATTVPFVRRRVITHRLA